MPSTTDKPLRILAFEPYDRGSHRAVRESISRHSAHQWTWITRPGRSWKWRLAVSAWEMVEIARQRGELHNAHDLVLCTSLTDTAHVRAALPSGLRNKPIVSYMHENQAAYPRGHQSHATQWDARFALTNLASILASDRIIWNSAWNRESFIGGINKLLEHHRDGVMKNLDDSIRAKSDVAWPPVESPPQTNSLPFERVLHNPPVIVWPHRWEHDKGPDRLLEIAIDPQYAEYRWIILGESFSGRPAEMDRLAQELGRRLLHLGFAQDRETYWKLLTSADWVLSTARHEFFGIAVVEAMLAGCLPWLPDELSYPELLPAECRDLAPSCPPDDVRRAREVIQRHLKPAVAPYAVHQIDRIIAGIAS